MAQARWDTKVQSPHGGQEWRNLENYQEDFSVTTNGLGIPEKALKAARDVLHTIGHYPPADFEPCKTVLATFLCGQKDQKIDQNDQKIDQKDQKIDQKDQISNMRSRLLLGNGASELIDLSIRDHNGSKWRPGPFDCQYMEYERAATAAGKTKCDPFDKSASLICIVNPCNPTGDFFPKDKFKEYINAHCEDNTTIIVDESMLPWAGRDWIKHSFVGNDGFSMYETRKINIIVIHSWTKLWCCPGLRIGSLVTKDAETAQELLRQQAPWSVNTLALAFLESAIEDKDYMDQTWSQTTMWREHLVSTLTHIWPSWKFYGEPWLSYVWIETGDAVLVDDLTRKCRDRGVPIRCGADGYKRPTCMRLGVRDILKTKSLLAALRP